MNKVLIVDDDQMNCDLLQSVFTRQGCHVISTTSGREGLDLFRGHNPRVTLLDLRMPEMNGLTVLKEIRAIAPTQLKGVTRRYPFGGLPPAT